MRPTRKRLLLATGASACLVVLLLGLVGSFVDLAMRASKQVSARERILTVHIEQSERKKESKLATGDNAVRPVPQEQIVSVEPADIRQNVATVDPSDPHADSTPVKDWQAIADAAAKASDDDYFRQEESRKSMWRQSRSIMFQATGDTAVPDEVPVLSDLRFVKRSRVFGLGLNIGSCFIGIPLAGIPVEERSTGPTVFICGQDSG